MYPNLTNPEIVTRAAEERERELRLQARGLSEAEGRSAIPARKTRAQARRDSVYIARIFAFLFH